MRIVDVCAFYAPRGGGVRTYIDRKLATGRAFGHEIIIVAPGARDGIERRGDGAEIHWLASPKFPLDGNYRYFADRKALHRCLDRLRPDFVEASSPWRSASMVADWDGAAPRALVAHADPLAAYAYRWFGKIADQAAIDRGFDWYWRHLRRLDTRFDLIVSASESLSRRLTAGGLRRVTTNPMGIQPGLFSPALRDERLRIDLLTRCGLDSRATLLIGLGRDAAEKRWGMVRAAVSAAGLAAPIGLILVGGGHMPGRKDAHPHVRSLGSVTDRHQLASLLASADALVHGCEAETFCFAAAEAAASGLALIVPDRGGASDIGRENGGLLYAAADTADLKRQILAFAAERGVVRPRNQGTARTLEDHFRQLFKDYEVLAHPERATIGYRGWKDIPHRRGAVGGVQRRLSYA